MWAVKHYTHFHSLCNTDGIIQFKLTAWANNKSSLGTIACFKFYYAYILFFSYVPH